jgi:quercetin dioxygenase-like cupin family protein
MPPNSCGSVALFLLGVVACGHAAPQATANPAERDVPVYQEPRHRLVFQSPLVRVLDVRVPAGDTTAYHIHANRLVGVAVRDARTWAQVKGAPPSAVKPAPATPYVFDNWSQTLPYTHRVANVDTVPLHYVGAELLMRSGTKTPALPDGPNRRLIKEGPTSRVYQITLAPGQAIEAHTHAAPGLVVQGNEGVLSDDGHPRTRGGKGAGNWSWHEAQYRHGLRNDGSTQLIVYEIDWR